MDDVTTTVPTPSLLLSDQPQQQCCTPTSSNNNRLSSISFSSIEIIELPYTVGDNPCVSGGVPISASWIAQKRTKFDLEFFERYRPKRRKKSELLMSRTDRKALLVQSGHTANEIMTAITEASRVRKERFETIFQLRLKYQGMIMRPTQYGLTLSPTNNRKQQHQQPQPHPQPQQHHHHNHHNQQNIIHYNHNHNQQYRTTTPPSSPLHNKNNNNEQDNYNFSPPLSRKRERQIQYYHHHHQQHHHHHVCQQGGGPSLASLRSPPPLRRPKRKHPGMRAPLTHHSHFRPLKPPSRFPMSPQHTTLFNKHSPPRTF